MDLGSHYTERILFVIFISSFTPETKVTFVNN